jgi:hypothetical protein
MPTIHDDEEELEHARLVHYDAVYRDSESEEIHEDSNEDHSDEDSSLDGLNTAQRGNIVVGGGRFTVKRNSKFNIDDIGGDLRTSRAQHLRDVLSRLLYSKEYWVFYITMIGISFFLLIWNIISGGQYVDEFIAKYSQNVAQDSFGLQH